MDDSRPRVGSETQQVSQQQTSGWAHQCLGWSCKSLSVISVHGERRQVHGLHQWQGDEDPIPVGLQ